MLNNGQTEVIKGLIDFINANYQFKGKYKLEFDKLQSTKDSICLTTIEQSNPIERVADVTGTALAGSVTLSIRYRVMHIEKSDDELSAIEVVDDLYNFIRSHYREVKNEKFFIDGITQVSGGVLNTVYSGGVKDFNGSFILQYERQVS